MEDNRLLQTILETLNELKTGQQHFAEETNQHFEQIDQHFEQIDRRFEQVDRRFEQVDQRINEIDQRLSGMDEKINQRFAQVDQRLSDLEEKVGHTRVMVEGLEHNICLIAEQYSDVAQKLNRIEEIDGLKNRVSVLEGVAITHTNQIKKLKQAE